MSAFHLTATFTQVGVLFQRCSLLTLFFFDVDLSKCCSLSLLFSHNVVLSPCCSLSAFYQRSSAISIANEWRLTPPRHLLHLLLLLQLPFHHRGDVKWVYGRTVDAPTAKAFSLQLRLILRLHFALFDVRNGIGAVLVNERCIIIYHEYPFNQYP